MEDEFEEIPNGERFDSWKAIELAVRADRKKWCLRARPEDPILVMDEDDPAGTGFVRFDHGTHTTDIDFEDFVPVRRSYTRKARAAVLY